MELPSHEFQLMWAKLGLRTFRNELYRFSFPKFLERDQQTGSQVNSLLLSVNSVRILITEFTRYIALFV